MNISRSEHIVTPDAMEASHAIARINAIFNDRTR